MKILAKTFIFFILFLPLIFSCKTNDKVKQGGPEPNWVKTANSEINDENKYYFVGSNKLSDIQLSLRSAEDLARVELANWLETQIVENIEVYTKTTSDKTGDSYEEYARISSKEYSSSLFSAVEKEDYYIEEDGTAWVLISISKENVLRSINTAVRLHEEEEAQRKESYVKANDMMRKAKSYL